MLKRLKLFLDWRFILFLVIVLAALTILVAIGNSILGQDGFTTGLKAAGAFLAAVFFALKFFDAHLDKRRLPQLIYAGLIIVQLWLFVSQVQLFTS